MSCENFTIIQGQFLSYKATAKDRETGNPKDISTGYSFKATIKNNRSDSDANAVVGPLTSAADPTRFNQDPGDVYSVEVFQLLTSESQSDLSPGKYWFDSWAIEDATGAAEPMKSGYLLVEDGVTDSL